LKDLDPVPEDLIKQRLMERERKKNIPDVLVELRKNHYSNKRK
jgi:hypothetical protein